MIERARPSGGFTLVEMAVGLFLVTIIGLAVGVFVQSSFQGYQATSTSLALEASGRQALTQMKRLLRPAVFTSMAPRLEGEFFSTSLDFQRSLGGVVQPLERLEWRLAPGEVDDGADNDGDGLVDEGRVIWTERVGQPDEREHVLLRNVSEYLFRETPNGLDDNGNVMRDEAGLCFNFRGRTLTIRLTTEERGPRGTPLRSSFESRIHVRN